VHKTDNLNDGYFGSGKILKQAIKKHGKASFKKTILQIFDSIEEMLNAESVVVDKYFVLREDTYNLKTGGLCGGLVGANNPMFGKHLSEEHKKQISAVHKGLKHTQESRLKMSESHKGNKGNCGRKLTEEHKKNISKKIKGRILSEEHKRKISEAHMGKMSKERREQLRISNAKRKWSDASKQKLIKSQKAYRLKQKSETI
jgi:hypothetical protein